MKVGKSLTAGVLFSGIGGWDLGAERAGIKVLWGCEIDKFCTKVLAKRWPGAPIYPDVQTLDPKEVAPVDILIASPPCQDLSVAGKRAGIAGARSGLFFDFVRIAAALRPSWLLMEQVPGLVSSHKGEDFRQVVEAITELGYGLSWRVLDSRHLGVPQRRRRMYFVGRLGEPCPFEVLFEPEGGGGDPAASRAEGAETPRAVGDGLAGALGGHHPRNDLDTSGAYIPEAAYAVTARDYKGVSQREGVTTLVAEDVAHTLRAQAQSAHAEDAETYIASPLRATDSPNGHGHSWGMRGDGTDNFVVDKEVAPTLRDHTRPTSNGDGGVIAFAWQQGDDSKFNKGGRGRSWIVRAGDYAGSVQAQRVDAVSIAPTMGTHQRPGNEGNDKAVVTHALKAEGADASEDGTGRGVPMVVAPDARPEQRVFSIMPQNGSKDYKAREVPVTQPLMAGGQSHGDQGGDVVLVVAPVDLRQTSRGDKDTNRRAEGSGGPPGVGVGEFGDPAFTVSERGQAVVEIAAPLTHGSFDKSHTPGRRMEDDVNLVVESVALRGRDGGATAETGGDQSHALRSSGGGGDKEHVAIYRKSKRAQTDTDDETWVESDETNTQNAFDVGDARATELILKPFTVHGEHSSAMTGNGEADVAFPTDTARSLDTSGGYATNQGGNVVEEIAQPVRTNPYNNSDPAMEAKMHVAPAGIVRRLTVTECERLQAFPDGWTCLEVDWITHPDIEGPYLGFPDGTPYSTEECSCPDGPRYRALGNAVTVNASEWVVQRLVRWIEFDRRATEIAKYIADQTMGDLPWLQEQQTA